MKNDFRKMLEAIEAIVARYYPVVEQQADSVAQSETPKARAASAGGAQ